MGKIPRFVKRVCPPEYPKDGEARSGKPMIVVRQDRYAVEENDHRPILKDFGLGVEFAGWLRWYETE